MHVSRERQYAAATATVRETAEALANGCSAAACTALCRRTAARLDDELARVRAEGAAIACAPGCAFCCHQRVSVLPHEAVALFGHLRTKIAADERAAIEQRLLANARRVDALTAAQHRAANLPCAFLTDGRCSAYEVRPSICASFHSLSRERCEQAFDHPEEMGTPSNSRPVLLEIEALAETLLAATGAGLEQAGLPSSKTELHQTLRALIEAAAAADANL